ncbi:hypothetical protein LDENG_00166380 [Lucifuga dentata]|nr:hypothetical protein LDENG_00166380 [Lucifuga dentata]
MFASFFSNLSNIKCSDTQSGFRSKTKIFRTNSAPTENGSTFKEACWRSRCVLVFRTADVFSTV